MIQLHNDCFLRNPTVPDPDRTDCSEAVPDTAKFHYSYMNQDYHPKVIEKWEAQGCKADIDRRLGYRFSLVGSPRSRHR